LNSHFLQKPYNVNLLIGGYDQKTGAALYWLDYLASMTALPYAAQGYGAFFCLSLMDRYHRPDLTEEEAIALMQKCVHEMQIRFMVNMPEFVFKIVDKNGVRDLGSFTGSKGTV
jgi:20S proteasome subunit beta 4